MMTLSHLKIAVLAGGPGAEREVSLRSGFNVARWLREAGAREVIEMDVRDEHFTLPPDVNLVFNSIHGTLGEDGRLQQILERQGVPYTGEGVRGSEIAFDKILTKRRFDERGVATPAYEVITKGDEPSFPPPMVIKAPLQGSSVGVHLVRERGQIAGAIHDVVQYGDEILIEELVTGRELTVGVVGDLALPVIMICPKQDFYDFKNKYPWLNPAGAADHFCPAPLSAELTDRVQALALAAHRALDLEVYSRVDILLDEQDEPFVLELNTIPGMTESSLLPEAARVMGVEPPQLCARIVELSLARFGKQS